MSSCFSMHHGKTDPLHSISKSLLNFRCGHCTKFKPTYAALAQRYASRSNLIVAQIDATANDIPKGFEVTGFPTIYLVPMNNQPVKYEGNRDIDDLVKFIENHSQFKSEL